MNRNLTIQEIQLALQKTLSILPARSRIYLTGGSAVLYQYKGIRNTTDIDILVYPDTDININRELKKHGIQVVNTNLVNVPDDYHERGHLLLSGSNGTKVYVLSPVDIAVSRTFRGHPVDFFDLWHSNLAEHINLQEFDTLYKQVLKEKGINKTSPLYIRLNSNRIQAMEIIRKKQQINQHIKTFHEILNDKIVQKLPTISPDVSITKLFKHCLDRVNSGKDHSIAPLMPYLQLKYLLSPPNEQKTFNNTYPQVATQFQHYLKNLLELPSRLTDSYEHINLKHHLKSLLPEPAGSPSLTPVLFTRLYNTFEEIVQKSRKAGRKNVQQQGLSLTR